MSTQTETKKRLNLEVFIIANETLEDYRKELTD